MSNKKFIINAHNINDFTKEELENMLGEIKETQLQINMTLDEVKYDLKEFDERPDADWFKRLKRAKRIKGYQNQLISQHLKKLKRKEAQKNTQIELDNVIRAMSEVLDLDTYNEIMIKADLPYKVKIVLYNN